MSASPTPREFNNGIGQLPPVVGQLAAPNLTTLWAWDASAKWLFYAPSLDNSGGIDAYVNSRDMLSFGQTKRLTPEMGFWVNRP